MLSKHLRDMSADEYLKDSIIDFENMTVSQRHVYYDMYFLYCEGKTFMCVCGRLSLPNLIPGIL